MPRVSDERRAEALAAMDAAVRSYPDVFGAECWCDDGDCLGDCEEAVPATAGVTGWVVVAETADLDPEGKTATTYRIGPSLGTNTALGMIWRVARRYC